MAMWKIMTLTFFQKFSSSFLFKNIMGSRSFEWPINYGRVHVKDYDIEFPQSAGVILTQNNCPMKNSFRIHF